MQRSALVLRCTWIDGIRVARSSSAGPCESNHGRAKLDRATHQPKCNEPLEQIPFLGSGSPLTDTGSKPGNPRGLNPAARDAISKNARGCSLISLRLVCGLVCISTGVASAQWPQWGGPNRDFMVETTDLADRWPEEGPPKLWHRPLGDGYASIIVDGELLYTLYRVEADEFTIALDAGTGETRWEHRNPSSSTEGMQHYGAGPHASPLVVGERVFTVGTNMVLHCFDKLSGKVYWRHDLPAEYGAQVPFFGYSCSPIAYANLVILPVDHWRQEPYGAKPESDLNEVERAACKQGQALMAFDQQTGALVWRAQDYPVDYSSPLLINFSGEDQLVLLMRQEIIGVKPATGELLWHQEVLPVPDENIATPLWVGDGRLFLSAAYNSGSRVVQLSQQEGKTEARQLWYTRKLRVLLGNAIRLGEHVYGSSGDFGTVLFTCLDLGTGKVRWRERGFSKASCVLADGKLILLDEDGNLALTTVTPEGMTVHSKCKVTEHLSWTPPTLVGKTLYVRDRRHIMALDIGKR